MRTRFNIFSTLFAYLVLLSLVTPAVAQSFLKLNLQFNDMDYNPVNDRIYAAYTGTASRGNSILVINPQNGFVEDTIVVRSEPYILRFSANYEYLYIGFYNWNGIARYKISTSQYEEPVVLTKWIENFGIKRMHINFIDELMPVPGQPDAIAAVMSRESSTVIFDGSIPRQDIVTGSQQQSHNMAYHAASGYIYGYGNEFPDRGLARYILSPSGITYDNTFSLLDGERYEIEIEGNRLYSQHGEVLDISGPAPVQTGNIYTSNGRTYHYGVMEYDPLTNVIYNLDWIPTPYGYYLYTIKPDDLSLLGRKLIPDYGTLKPMKMISTGHAGSLAVLADPEETWKTPISGNLILIHDCDESGITNIPVTNSGGTTICSGDSLTLTAAGSYDQYIWTNGMSGSQVTIPFTATKTISVSGYDATGCRKGASTPLTITVIEPPAWTGSNIMFYDICKGDTLTLTPYSSNATYYIWSTGEQAPTIKVTQPGYYTMNAYTGPGCTDGITRGKVVNWYSAIDIPEPVVTPSGPFNFCEGDTVELSTHTDIYEYQWKHNGNPFDHVFITKTGEYQVRFKDAYGCYGPYSDSVSVSVNTPPAVPVLRKKDSLLYVLNTTLELEWFFNGDLIPTPVNDSLVATAYGFYSIRAKSPEGCYSKFGAGVKMDTPALPNPALMNGFVFADYNENNVFDGTDIVLANQRIRILPYSFVTFTDDQGRYDFFLPGGHYEVLLEVDTAIWEVRLGKNGLSIDLDASQPDTNIFSAVPKILTPRFDINFWNGQLRCNREVPVYPSLRNDGTKIISGAYCFVPDERVLAVIDNGIVQLPLPDTICWEIDSLAPTFEWRHNLEILIPGVESAHDSLTMGVYVTLNSGVTDSNEKKERIRCSYDPNDKQVLPVRRPNGNYAYLHDTLEYTIRFQNSGNDTAFSITLVDELSDDLIWSSFRPLSASHPYHVMLDLIKGRVEVVFDPILLPDSTTNYAGSQGYFSFSILPKPGLTDHTPIINAAEIYFDSNPGVATNSVEVELVNTLPTKIDDIEDESIEVIISPNPNEGWFTLHVNGLRSNSIFEVFDLLGRRWVTKELIETNQDLSIDTFHWPAGLFEYQIREKGSHRLRVNGLLVRL
ncbi:MAG TPA: hypothetical protein VFG10_07370 [Saprospiraceae bacterium]|nr:hypothetical protein [Saprospiraceae bacterium]